MHGDGFSNLLYNNLLFLLILFPALDGNIINGHRTESIDKCTCQTGVRYQRNVQVDSRATYFISIIQFSCGQVLRDIDYHVNLLTMKHFQCLRMAFVHSASRQAYFQCRSQQRFYEYRRLQRVLSLVLKHTRCRNHVHFLLRSTGRKQDIFLWNTISHGEHRLENGAGSIAADAAHLARRSHITHPIPGQPFANG